MTLPAYYHPTTNLMPPSTTTTTTTTTTNNLRVPRSSFVRPCLASSSPSVRPLMATSSSSFARPRLASASPSVRPLLATARESSNPEPEPKKPWVKWMARVIHCLIPGLILMGLKLWGIDLLSSRGSFFFDLLTAAIDLAKLAGWM